MTNYYNVGKIVNTHGIRGEVRVITSSDFAAERYQPGNLVYFFRDDTSEGIPLTISNHRVHKNFDLLTFEKHTSINDVEKYKGGSIKITESDRMELDEGEFYYDHIIGCEVFTDAGEPLGKVKEILSPGANDVWVVQRHEAGKDILIPYIADVVKDVQIEEKKIIVHIIEGLI
jgi:16S rRNA processing protein RimM